MNAVKYLRMAGMCRKNLWSYMHTHLGVPEGQQEKIWRPLFQKYNQSLRALRAGGFEFKEEEYWDCLRAGAEDYLEPAPQVLSESPPYTGMITKCSPVMRRTQAVLSMCSSAQASLQVRALLESLPQEKWVFTNCNEKHATHALRLLGIEVLIPEENQIDDSLSKSVCSVSKPVH